MDLAQVLGDLPQNEDSRVLADFRLASDAGVYLLDEERALVQTVDFFTPIVDEPDVYGAVAAANSLSDLYAMGAAPLTALSIVGFPEKGVALRVLGEMLRGGHDKLHEAGAVLLGGHTVRDPEIKLGFAVTGLVDPRRLVRNAGAKVGDLLYLTKPLGTGVLATALKKGKLAEGVRAHLYESLTALNARAADAMVEVGVSAATDVTGFGLLGHAGELCRASNVAIEILSAAIPLLPEAYRFQSKGCVTGAVETNRRYVSDILEIDEQLDHNTLGLLLDPQTSGGLLISVPATRQTVFEEALDERGAVGVSIGRVVSEGAPRIHLR